MDQNIRTRRLPLGLQSFEIIRREGYLYVDKTDIVWQLANADSRFTYLSRPRRFGKSLLVDTLACYFEGKKELFEGLKIMELEKDWKAHPVLRFDMSNGGASADDLNSYFDNEFRRYEEQFSIPSRDNDGLTVRFSNIIRGAAKNTGHPVVVLIDEYDSPLQHSWHTPDHEAVTAIYRKVFSVLKTETLSERFVFLTGITKFTQISLFSVLNNLTNVSFMPQYAALCGITQHELQENFMPEIEQMAADRDETADNTIAELKQKYDGYHFAARNMEDIYNPFSLVCALADMEFGNYWVSSGATSMLLKFVDNMDLRIKKIDNVSIDRAILESSDVTGGAELFLYQSGYLTIKSYARGSYVLGSPNHEVRQALYDVVLPALTMRKQNDVRTAQSQLLRHMNFNEVESAMQALKALIADVPYSNKRLESMDMEERYRFIISSIFNAIGLRVEVEHMMAKGRIDMVVRAWDAIYVIELKLTKNGGLAAAEQQIRDNLYAEPFQADGLEVIPLAIELDDLGRGLIAWKRVE